MNVYVFELRPTGFYLTTSNVVAARYTVSAPKQSIAREKAWELTEWDEESRKDGRYRLVLVEAYDQESFKLSHSVDTSQTDQ